MTLIAIAMVKDEGDVIGDVIRHLASEGVQTIGILENCSTDDTLEQIDKATIEVEKGKRCRVKVVHDGEVGYYQSRKITALLEFLAMPGDWIVPFDADELWHAEVRLDEFFMSRPAAVEAVDAQLLTHLASGCDRSAGNVFERFEYRDPTIAPLPKVAFRFERGAVVAQGAHGVQFTGRGRLHASGLHEAGSGLTVRHFPYRSEGQMITKVRNGAAAYAATDLPASTGDHWRSMGRLSNGELEELYRSKYTHPWPLEAGQVHDPAPWCRWR